MPLRAHSMVSRRACSGHSPRHGRRSAGLHQSTSSRPRSHALHVAAVSDLPVPRSKPRNSLATVSSTPPLIDVHEICKIDQIRRLVQLLLAISIHIHSIQSACKRSNSVAPFFLRACTTHRQQVVCRISNFAHRQTYRQFIQPTDEMLSVSWLLLCM
jgi:hypothetical protein